MSRSKHQKHRHSGEDFWSKRGGGGQLAVSTYNKKLTVRRERMEKKESVIKELKEMSYEIQQS